MKAVIPIAKKRRKILHADGTYEGWREATGELFVTFWKLWAPPPKLTISEWADRHMMLSAEGSAEPGRWQTSRAPYQREIMDTLGDPMVERIVIMTSSQVGKSSVLNNFIGYISHLDPGTMLMIQPTIKTAADYVRQRIDPMIRDTPVLTATFAKQKSRSAMNSLTVKGFRGGQLYISGSNSPAALASKPVPYILLDEVDRYEGNVGDEGDPVKLVEQRAATFPNRKIIMTSTPTTKGTSRIEMAYEESSQGIWQVKCPNCGEYQQLLWHHIKYEKHPSRPECIGEPMASCQHCGVLSGEWEWKDSPGKWLHREPDAETKGFHVNALVSPWSSWRILANDWITAQGNVELLQVFVNTKLGEVWEVPGDVVAAHDLTKRCQNYGAQVPDGVLVLTCAVDVQGDRIEYEVKGWGRGKSSWGIKYGKIYGDPKQTFDYLVEGLPVRSVWTQLDEVLQDTYRYRDGSTINIVRCCVDSGGHAANAVYRYCVAREPLVYAIKGIGGEGRGIIHTHSKTRKENASLIIIGVDTAKDTVFARLQYENTALGSCHFPTDPDAGYDEEYFVGLTNEKRTRVKDKRKFWIYRYEIIESSVGNEPLDLAVYNTAAMELLNPNFEVLAQHRAKAVLPLTDVTDATRRPPPAMTRTIIKPQTSAYVRV